VIHAKLASQEVRAAAMAGADARWPARDAMRSGNLVAP
jgi:hypothetical protein